jgi:hypothetical protein
LSYGTIKFWLLGRIFGPKWEEMTRGYRRLHNEEICNLYASQNIVRMSRLRRTSGAGHVARLGEMRNAYTVLVGKPEETRPRGRPRRRGDDNIRMNPRKTEWKNMVWIQLAQDRDN